MIEGEQRYSADDLRTAGALFGRGNTLALWQGAVATLLLGTVLGVGAAAFAAKLGGPDFDLSSPLIGWAALAGAVAVTFAAAIRLSRLAERPLALPPQRIGVDGEGIHLRSETAESLLRWTHFVASRRTAGLIALQTTDGSFVLLKPQYFPAGSFAAVETLVTAGLDPRPGHTAVE